MDADARLTEVFFEVQRGLPRQGPGSEACTLRALGWCVGLPKAPAVLDVGCGPGMQTLALARVTSGRITAVDLYEEYLDQLREDAARAGLTEQIAIVQADMARLPFAESNFDLIWAEGSAYIMGFAEALRAWRPLLRPGGYLAATELVWLQEDPPRAVAAFFQNEYPAMAYVDRVATLFGATGYELIDRFNLPDSSWWDDYYGPLEAKLPDLEAAYAGDPEALEVVDGTRREIKMRREYPEVYGYAFFVARKANE